LQNELALIKGLLWASSRLLDRRPPLPGPKCFHLGTPITDGTEAMAPWSEVVVDDGVRRKKVLRLAGRLESLHLPFTPSCRPM
jgi:hypothetical protein